MLSRQPDTSFAPPPNGNAPRSYDIAHLQRQKMVRYRVLMEPIGTNVFFLAPWARSVSGDYRLLAGDSGGAVYDFDSQRAISKYEATSDIATPSPSELQSAGHNYPKLITEQYLRLPETDPRIPKLASQITNQAANEYDRTAAVENYLRTHFVY